MTLTALLEQLFVHSSSTKLKSRSTVMAPSLSASHQMLPELMLLALMALPVRKEKLLGAVTCTKELAEMTIALAGTSFNGTNSTTQPLIL